MRVYIDLEFVHGWKRTEIVSIGAIREDNETYYAINRNMNLEESGEWLTRNVITRLERNPDLWKPKFQIADELKDFLGFGRTEGWVPDHHHTRVGRPELWGWFPAYDWFLVSSLYGPFDEHPANFPNTVHCLYSWLEAVEYEKNYGRTRLTKPQNAHNALADAKWVKEYHELLLDKMNKAERSFVECLR